MWWIFPQHVELGYSPIAKLYGITCLDEARAFLADEYLGACLRDPALRGYGVASGVVRFDNLST